MKNFRFPNQIIADLSPCYIYLNKDFRQAVKQVDRPRNNEVDVNTNVFAANYVIDRNKRPVEYENRPCTVMYDGGDAERRKLINPRIRSAHACAWASATRHEFDSSDM